MGATRDDFIKYARTPHLFGSKGTDDDGPPCRIPCGPATADELRGLTGPSAFDSAFDHPVTGRTDHLMEGLYVRIPRLRDHVTGRAKTVQPEFVEKVQQSEHWQHQAMVPNELVEGVEIWG